MLANRGAGAQYLEENAQVLHYNEGPAEKLEQWLKIYEEKVRMCTEKQVVTWLVGMAKMKNLKLGLILNCAEIKGYLQDLEEFLPLFMVDGLYGQKFCIGFLHEVNGGLSG